MLVMHFLRNAMFVLAAGLAACTQESSTLAPAPGASNATEQPAGNVAGAQATLILEEEPCSHCVSTVRTTLAKIEGILKVDIKAESREFVVHYDPAKVKPEALLEPLKAAGEPAKIKT